MATSPGIQTNFPALGAASGGNSGGLIESGAGLFRLEEIRGAINTIAFYDVYFKGNA